MDYYQKELDRYLERHKDEFSEKVVEYGKSFIERVKDNEVLQEYFSYNNIGIYPFLSELLPVAEHKLKSIGGEKLDENEINQVFGSVILNNEVLKLLLKDDIIINGLNSYGEFVYELNDDAVYYFNSKYGIKFNRKFSMRDILIINLDDEDDEESDDILNLLN